MDRRVFMVGLPSAGKTTFLAALWYSLTQCDLQLELELEKMGDNAYLSSLSEQWANVEPLSRTTMTEEREQLTMKLKSRQGETIDIEIPDLSGETFQRLFNERVIGRRIADKIRDADLIMFLVNAAQIKAPVFISDFIKQMGRLNLEERNEKLRNAWDANEDVPTEVQVVDLLQMIAEIHGKKTRLALVVSAWDEVMAQDTEMTPEQYLRREMNLVLQYLDGNRDRFEVDIWAVSAQGGTIEEAERLRAIDEPVERIRVVNNELGSSHDLTKIFVAG